VENGKNTESTSDNFEQVAAQVTAAPVALEPEPVVASEPSVSAPVNPETRLTVSDGVAMEAVKIIFIPFAAKDNRWLLSDQEAQYAVPQMRAFLQVCADKYLPELLAKYAEKNRELAELVLVLSIVVFQKARAIRAADAAVGGGAPAAAPVRSSMPASVDA
jgi:hypothetical protein